MLFFQLNQLHAIFVAMYILKTLLYMKLADYSMHLRPSACQHQNDFLFFIWRETNMNIEHIQGVVIYIFVMIEFIITIN